MREKSRLRLGAIIREYPKARPEMAEFFRRARPAMLANLAFAAFRACVRVFVRARAILRLAMYSLIFDVICQKALPPKKNF